MHGQVILWHPFFFFRHVAVSHRPFSCLKWRDTMPRRGRPVAPVTLSAAAGSFHGGIAAGVLYANQAAFSEAVRREEAATAFVEYILACRACRRRRHTYARFQELLGRGQRPLFVSRVMQEAFAVYCIARRVAAPQAPRPEVLTESGVHLPRRVQRTLRHHGVTGDTISERRTLRDRAQDQRDRLWRTMYKRQCVVWVDNYFRKRFVANPAVGYNALKCSVVSVLHVPEVDMCPPLPTVDELLRNRSPLTQRLECAVRDLLDTVSDITSTDIVPGTIRVPLDISRPDVRSLQWTPLMMSPLWVTKNSDFVTLMEEIRTTVLPHCRSPLPVLMDLNIYYRHLKLCYGRGYVRWDYARHFRYCPPLFGVWHSYKYACKLVYRYFHSQVMYLQHGTVAVGDNFPTDPRLRTVELLYGAILLLPSTVRADLRDAVNHRLRALTEMRTRHATWEKFHARRRMMTERERETVDRTRRAHGRAEHQAEHCLRQMEAMEALVNHYVPALFVIGHLVRECNWNGRDASTARHARDSMLYAACVMMSLLGDRASGNEHLRDVCLALLAWQHWHDGLRGAMFSEEVAEASLGRFGESLRSNPHVVDADAASDLFQLVRPGSLGHRAIRTEGPTAPFVSMVRGNLGTMIQTVLNCVTYVPWLPRRMCTAVRKPCALNAFPRPLGQVPSFDGIRALLDHFLHTLVSCPEPKATGKLFTVLDGCVPRRHLPDRLSAEHSLAQVHPSRGLFKEIFHRNRQEEQWQARVP